MSNQINTPRSESMKTLNQVIAIAITAALILLDQVTHLPLWFTVPCAAAMALGVRYVHLKRAVMIQHKEYK
ncbi:hypothetical protein D3C72_151070 [compost metagenome]